MTASIANLYPICNCKQLSIIPLIQIEKRPNSEGTAIVNEVVPGSQADLAGMKRGDILCFAGSNGKEEMMYDMFLELAKSPQRPIRKLFLQFFLLLFNSFDGDMYTLFCMYILEAQNEI